MTRQQAITILTEGEADMAPIFGSLNTFILPHCPTEVLVMRAKDFVRIAQDPAEYERLISLSCSSTDRIEVS